MPSTVTPHKKKLAKGDSVPNSPYLCFDSLQLCSQQLQVPLQALNLEIPVRQNTHSHSVLAQIACCNQIVGLTITGYSEKHTLAHLSSKPPFGGPNA